MNVITTEMPHGSQEKFYTNTSHEAEWTIKQLADYFGRDYSLLELPLGLEYLANTRNIVIINNDDSVVSDTTIFAFINNYEVYALIMVSKTGSPSTTLYQFEQEKLKLSKIKETEIVVGGRLLDENSEVFDLLVANFSQNEKRFHIEVCNITIKDFEAILEAVIK